MSLILGAGAAGMMAAIEAGKRGRSVLVVDHAEAPGEKIRISGGGRCNFTNVNTPRRDRFLSQQSALRPLGALPLHPAALHRPGEELRHRLSRKDPRPTVLRRLGGADHQPADQPRWARRASTLELGTEIEAVEKTDAGFRDPALDR